MSVRASMCLARPSPARGSCTAACRARARSASCAGRRRAAPRARCRSRRRAPAPSCSRMFSGLMSRWTTPCAVRVVERARRSVARRSQARRRSAACRSRSNAVAQRLAFDVRHHVERGSRRPRRSRAAAGCADMPSSHSTHDVRRLSPSPPRLSHRRIPPPIAPSPPSRGSCR